MATFNRPFKVRLTTLTHTQKQLLARKFRELYGRVEVGGNVHKTYLTSSEHGWGFHNAVPNPEYKTIHINHIKRIFDLGE